MELLLENAGRCLVGEQTLWEILRGTSTAPGDVNYNLYFFACFVYIP